MSECPLVLFHHYLWWEWGGGLMTWCVETDEDLRLMRGWWDHPTFCSWWWFIQNSLLKNTFKCLVIRYHKISQYLHCLIIIKPSKAEKYVLPDPPKDVAKNHPKVLTFWEISYSESGKIDTTLIFVWWIWSYCTKQPALPRFAKIN